MNKPMLTIIGGANGSGKTTLAREYVAVENLEYLGADDIAFELNPVNLESVAIEAARIFSRRFDDYLERRVPLVVESTLSGLSLKKWIKKARSFDYGVKILFVYLDSPELCIQRIAARVAAGGHHVSDSDVRRRFVRSNANFWKIYKDLADEWNLFFNTGDSFEQIAAADLRGVIIFDETRYLQWQKMVKTKIKPER
jgi:predicted ABC-type ATPase